MSSPRNVVLNEIIQCIEVAAEMDSDDSEKEHVLIALTELANKATYLKCEKKQWIKPWRAARKQRGLISFLTNELLLGDEESYKNYLRMTKMQFETVLNLIERDIKRSDTLMREAISPAEKLGLTLRFLATGESFRSIETQTRVSKSAISGVIPEVCEAIWKRLEATYLKLPNNISEWENNAKEFEMKWKFPNCLGALHEKTINLRPPQRDAPTSIILMALIDANCKFVYVVVGRNGCSDDDRVFLKSKLRRILEEGKDIPTNAVVGNGRCIPYVVLGDNTFPLQTHLMAPYPFQTSSAEKQTFNAHLSRARQVVDKAFGIFDNQFGLFLTHISLKVETVEKIIFACCVLHNFLIQSDDTYLKTLKIFNNSFLKNNSGNPVYNSQRGEAEAIRQQFAAYFFNEGKLNLT